MEISFLGGAGEVGASCYLIQIDGKNILLDCGIRMKGSDPLPDLRQIQKKGGLDAIIVSHAHLDHSGSLPVISREYEGARICMTHASKALIRVLLYDSLKIMEREEADIPIYAEKHVVEMLDRCVCYSPQFTFKPIPGSELKVTFYNAGHIAGAALVYIQGKEGTLLYTGDFSATDQQTVIGGSVPKLRPDVMISESTYGDKIHSNRELEEERLVATVREVIKRKGKILIPAFALGRAQEVILLLRKAINKKQLPVFNIFVDGMVRAINRIYRLHPNYLQPFLAKKIFKGNDIFYNDNVIEVENHEMREEIVDNDVPYCIISSSGMLKGGPSSFYAEHLADKEDNFIAITGYQDEETPGSDILDLVDTEREERVLELNKKKVQLKCDFGKYGLSAHADKGELKGLIHRVSPRKLFLVHGNQEIIEQLAVDINNDIWSNIYVPANGKSYTAQFDNPRKQLEFSNNLRSLNKNERLNQDNIEELWQYIYKNTGIETGYSIEELIHIQEGKKKYSENKIEKYRELLNDTIYFTPNRRRLFLYHPVSKEELKEAQGDGLVEMNKMFSLVEEYFPPETGLYKKGARIEENIVLLNFNFPDIAAQKYQEKIKELEEVTGWQAELNEDCNQVALEDMVYRLLPANINVDKFSYYRNKKNCEVEIDKEPDDIQIIKEEFQKKSGIDLILNHPGQKSVKPTAEISLKEVNQENMMEQNQAFSYIDDKFQKKDVKIYKKSRKQTQGIPYIELSFISLEVGERYQELINELEDKIGWNIKIAQNPVQNEIINLARRLCLSNNMSLKKNPSFYRDKLMVEAVVREKTEEETISELKKEFTEKTGYTLEIVS